MLERRFAHPLLHCLNVLNLLLIGEYLPTNGPPQLDVTVTVVVVNGQASATEETVSVPPKKHHLVHCVQDSDMVGWTAGRHGCFNLFNV